ncbi:MAG: PKD domain-containing protein, partial [Ferruginibacter sp.]
TSTVQNPSHVYPTTGVYNVTLTVTTDSGCVSNPIATIPVTINDRPAAGFIIPEVCLSDTYAQFTDTSSITTGTITGWQWNFGDPASGPNNTSTLQNPQHSYSAVGAYNVELIVTSNNGCTDTIVQSLFVNGSFPVANFTVNNPATLCANDSVSIVEASTVFPGVITKVEIYWDNVGFPGTFDLDDNPITGKVYKHLYPNFQSPLTRTFTIRYRAYSGGVCVNDRIANITVNAAPLVQFNAMPDACLLATPFQITQASEVGGVPGTGTFTGPGVSPTGLFSPLVAGIGTHTIMYTFISATGGCVDTMSNIITVLDTATAKFSYVSPICEGNAASFTEESTAPASVTLSNTSWDFGDGTPIENHLPGTTFTHTFPASGTFMVSMYNVSAYGCSSTPHVLPVTVSPRPVPAFAVDKPDYCLPNAIVKFNNLSAIADGSPLIYSWEFGDPASGNNTSSALSPTHWFSGVGPYSVKLQVTSNVGCIHDTTIIVNNIHPQPKADFSFSKPAICIGDDITITDNSDGKDGIINQWNWDLGDGTTRTTSTVNYTYTDTITYNVVLYTVNSIGCNSDTLTKQFTVYPYPHVNAGPDRFILEGGTITLEPVTFANDAQYLWTPNLYLIDNKIAKVKVHQPLTDMTYTLTVTGRGGCPLSDDVFIKLLKFPVIPNTFTPNNDGINDTWRIDYLNTYPDNRVQIFTRAGQLIFESRGYNTPWDGTLKGKSMPIDTYYYIIEPGNGRDPITGYVTILK